MPIHVAAAAWRGRPVSFEVLGPWNIPERMQEQAQAAGLVISNYGCLVFILSAWAAALFMARRNLRLGRGDRRGAIRIATFVFSGVVLSWVFSAHHVPSQDEGWMFLNFVAVAVFLGAFVWLAYIAIEPIVRRRWPELLFSWSRLLSGRFRDPLVGRDVLAGILIGALMTAAARSRVCDSQLGRPRRDDPDAPVGGDDAERRRSRVSPLLGVLHAPLNGLGFLTILVLSQVVLRRRWLAVGLTGILLVVVGLSGENSAVEIPAAVACGPLSSSSQRSASASSRSPSPCSSIGCWPRLRSRWICPAGTRHEGSSSSG